jgi:hypothetical protein
VRGGDLVKYFSSDWSTHVLSDAEGGSLVPVKPWMHSVVMSENRALGSGT